MARIAALRGHHAVIKQRSIVKGVGRNPMARCTFRDTARRNVFSAASGRSLSVVATHTVADEIRTHVFRHCRVPIVRVMADITLLCRLQMLGAFTLRDLTVVTAAASSNNFLMIHLGHDRE